MPEQSEKIDRHLDPDAEKQRALEALQHGAEELSDAFLRDALARNTPKEGAPIEEAGVNLGNSTPSLEQTPVEQIPLSGGLPDLNASIQNGQETVAEVQTRLENIMRGNVDIAPNSAIDDIGRIIEDADKE
jgi:hypothetical protein